MGKPDAVERLGGKVRWYGDAPEDLAFYERATVGDLRAILAYVAELEGALERYANLECAVKDMIDADDEGMNTVRCKVAGLVQVRGAAAALTGEKGGG